MKKSNPTPDRRQLLAFGAASTAALTLSAAGVATSAHAQAADRKPIVLIHGAFQGGWAWRLLSPLLRQAGYPVTSPTLSGMGERRNVPSQASGLLAHIDDIVNHLEMEDLRDVTLVGHSYAGCVLSGVLARKTGRVAHGLYLDAYAPGKGEGLISYLPKGEQAEFEKLAVGGGTIPVPPRTTWGERWGLNIESMNDWAEPRMTPQPVRTFTELVAEDPFSQPVKLTYLKCRENPNPGFWAMAERIKADRRFTYREIAGHHMIMLLNPQRLASELIASI